MDSYERQSMLRILGRALRIGATERPAVKVERMAGRRGSRQILECVALQLSNSAHPRALPAAILSAVIALARMSAAVIGRAQTTFASTGAGSSESNRPISAILTGARPAHPIGDCVVDGHRRCGTCDSLIECEEGVGPEMEA